MGIRSILAKAHKTFGPAHKKYTDVKKKVDYIQGKYSDAKKIYTVADNIIFDNVHKTSYLSSVAIDSLSMLTTKCPMVGHYLDAHKFHFEQLFALMKETETTDNSIRLFNKCNKVARDIRDACDEVIYKYDYVFNMTNENGVIGRKMLNSNDLPIEFREYYSAEMRSEDWDADAGMHDLSNSNYTQEKQKELTRTGSMLKRHILDCEIECGTVIVKSYAEVSHAYHAIRKDLMSLIKNMGKGAEAYKRQTDGKNGNAGSFSASGARRKLEHSHYMRARANGDDKFLELTSMSNDLYYYSKNAITKMQFYKIIGTRYRDLIRLAKAWQLWSIKVDADMDFMQVY